jgi:hypothetical protein
MEVQALKDENIFPGEKVLKATLGNSYPAFSALQAAINEPVNGLSLEWRYYNEGKAWLGKVTAKKKTVLWLSAWNGFFKTTFYFTEKTGMGVIDLDIDPSLKNDFNAAKPIGKLIPLTLNIRGSEQINDLHKIIQYKQELK